MPIPENYDFLPEGLFLICDNEGYVRMAELEYGEIQVYLIDGDDEPIEPVYYHEIVGPVIE